MRNLARLRTTGVFLAAGMIALAGCSSSSRSELEASPAEVSAAPAPVVLTEGEGWAFQPGKGTAGAVAVPGGFASGRQDTSVTAFEPATGRELWSAPLPGRLLALGSDASGDAPARTVYGLVAAPAGSPLVRAWEAATGRQVWETPWEGPATVDRPVVRVAGDVVVVADATRIVALARTDGAVRWRTAVTAQAVDAGGSAVAVLSGGAGTGSLAVHDAPTGRLLWQSASGSQIGEPFAVAGDTVVVLGPQVGPVVKGLGIEGTLTGYDARTGAVAWTAPRASAWDVPHDVAVNETAGVLLEFRDEFADLSSPDGNVPHLGGRDLASGAPRWKAPLNQANLPGMALAVAYGHAYVIDAGVLRVFDARTGEEKFSREVDTGEAQPSLSVVPGAVIVHGTGASNVYPVADYAAPL